MVVLFGVPDAIQSGPQTEQGRTTGKLQIEKFRDFANRYPSGGNFYVFKLLNLQWQKLMSIVAQNFNFGAFYFYKIL